VTAKDGVGRLCLGLLPGDTVAIGDSVIVTFVKYRGKYAVVAIECPRNIPIERNQYRSYRREEGSGDVLRK